METFDGFENGDHERASPKAVALEVRLRLGRVVEGSTSTVLDDLLTGRSLQAEPLRLTRRHLQDPANLNLVNPSHQQPDLLISLVSKLDLSTSLGSDFKGAPLGLWDTKLGEVVDLASSYANIVYESFASHFEPEPRQQRLLARNVNCSPEEWRRRLESALFAQLSQSKTPLGELSTEMARRVFERATGQVVCRTIVSRAAKMMSVYWATRGVNDRLGEAKAYAWSEVGEVVNNQYHSIEPEGGRLDTNEIKRFASYIRHYADLASPVDLELLTAVHKYAISVSHFKILHRVADARRLPTLTGQPNDDYPESDPIETLLMKQQEREGTSTSVDDDLLSAEETRRLQSHLQQLTDVAMAEGQDQMLADGLALLSFCYKHFGACADDWLVTHYEPLAKASNSAFFWSLLRATRPHDIIWPGYETPSNRQRQAVTRFARKFRQALGGLREEQLK